RGLALGDGALDVRLEHDDEWVTATVSLPAVISVAERLCDPCKVPPGGRAEVSAEGLRAVGVADLGPGPSGAGGTPTPGGEARTGAVERLARKLEGPVDEAVDKAVQVLLDRGVLEPGNLTERSEQVVAHAPGGGPALGVVVEPDREHVARELL